MTCDRAVDANCRDASADDPTNGVTTYPVIADPFVVVGRPQLTVACAFPGTALGDRGAVGGEIAAYDVGAPRSATHNTHVSKSAVRQVVRVLGRAVITWFLGCQRGTGYFWQGHLHSEREGRQGGRRVLPRSRALIRAQHGWATAIRPNGHPRCCGSACRRSPSAAARRS